LKEIGKISFKPERARFSRRFCGRPRAFRLSVLEGDGASSGEIRGARKKNRRKNGSKSGKICGFEGKRSWRREAPGKTRRKKSSADGKSSNRKRRR